MKEITRDFIRRGVAASGMGPLILAVLYLILQRQGVLEMLTVRQVSLGIFSLWMLAFLAGGLNVVYRIERLPLMAAVTIHGAVLYAGYLVTYLVNGWLEWGLMPVLVFSGIFILGYLAIWAVIYSVIRRNTRKINEILREKQRQEGQK